MWKWIRIPKAIALLAFFLPWMTVSCSGQPLAHASGFGLAFGHIEPVTSSLSNNPASSSGEWALLLVMAIVLIVVGLAVSFARPDKRLALLLTITSSLAFIAIWLGTSKYGKDAMLAEARRHGDQNFDPSALALIQVEWHFGFYLALAMLALAGGMAWAVWSGNDPLAHAPDRPLGG